jgi:outer membrane receptor protein involved in Fe transport
MELEGIDLDPETIDTYEMSLGAEFTSSLSSRVTFYYNESEDSIVATSSVVPLDLVNDPGNVRDHGFEIEVAYEFGRGTYLAGHYNYRRFHEGDHGWHVGSIMASIRLSRYLNFYADCQFNDGRERWAPGDDQDDPSGYAIVNATLIAKKFLEGYEGLEFRGSAYNLLDKDYRADVGPTIPNDLPEPGIHFLFEVKYKF